MYDKRQFIRASWDIIEGLLGEESLEEALDSTLQIMMRYLRAEAGAIWLLDQDRKRLLPMFFSGPTDLSGTSIEFGDGIESLTVKTGEAIIIRDAATDERFTGSVFDNRDFHTKLMMCVPLNDRKTDIGCIQIINTTDGTDFDEDELSLCKRMASLAAMTITEKNLKIEAEEKKEVLASLRGVTKVYGEGDNLTRVLRGINLDIYKGELLVVLGESGCGKSTMMNIIGGMDDLTDGTLFVEGEDLSHATEEQLTGLRRNYIGFVFQSFNLMPNLSALENIKFIAEICKNPLDPREALDKVGLSERANHFPSQMSGGQQQRVAIARALVKNPKLILADEPTAALDYKTSIEVLSVIEKTVREQNTTVIMVTHNPEIGKMADRVVNIRGGKVFSIRRNIRPQSATELVW